MSTNTQEPVEGQSADPVADLDEIMGGGTFNPGRYVKNIKDSRKPDAPDRWYLEVKYRLLWFRTEHPGGNIETTLHTLTDTFALFRASASIPGGGSATGWGSETRSDWGDFIEKAETKALGRALAALGYGTQFCDDYDFSIANPVNTGRVVDSPVDAPGGHRAGGGTGSSLATPAQLKLIYLTANRDLRITDEEMEEQCQARYGRLPMHLTKREASEFIDAMKEGKVQAGEAPPAGQRPTPPSTPVPPESPRLPSDIALATVAFARLVDAAPRPTWAGDDKAVNSLAKRLAEELERQGMTREGRMAMYEALTGFTSGVAMDPRQLAVLESLIDQASTLESIGQARLLARSKSAKP